ncbi:MAG: hypothetical protein AAFN17_01400 [Pseudomonadota bacterium]
MLLLLVNVVLGVFALMTIGRCDRGPDTLLRTVTLFSALLATLGVVHAATMVGVFFNLDNYLNDFFSTMEAINKAASGVRSSIDYFNPIGPLYEWIFLIAIEFREPSASTVFIANALVAAFGCLLGLVMLRRRASVPALALLMLTIVGVAISGRAQEMPISDAPLAYLAPYNRWGWALFVPAAAALALPVPDRDRLGAVAIGVAIALLVMLKVTYAVGLLGLIAVRAVILPGGYRDAVPAVLCALGILAIAEALTGQLSANLADVMWASTFPDNGMRFGKLIRQSGELTLFCGVALFVLIMTKQDGPPEQSSLPAFLTRPALMIFATACAGSAVLLQNHPAFEAPVYVLLLLFALEWNRVLGSPVGSGGGRSPLLERHQPRLLIAATVFGIAFLPAVDITQQIATRFVLKSYSPHEPFVGTGLADLQLHSRLIAHDVTRTNRHHIGYNATVAGMELLRRAGPDAPSGEVVLALAFANPFPILFGLPSPPGAPLWLHEGRSYNAADPLPAEKFFADVTLLLVSKLPMELNQVYGDAISEGFVEVDQNNFWILYRPR